MMRMLSGLLLLLYLFSASSSAQPKPCAVTDHAEYTKKIKEFTTEPFFSTELVDHLPLSSCAPPPDAFLHHIVGAPDILDYTKDINAYFRLLASKSPRVKVWSIGTSEEGREMLVVAVSDEANLAKLDRYKEITARLADPRGTSDAEAQKLVAEGKPMYWADGSIHSPETGAPEMLMELAYRLAVEDTPFIQKIRNDSIVLITPIVEVDGHDRMVDVYLQHKKHPDEPPYPLIWWGHYVSHDNNRDNLGVTLALSRNMLRTYLDFHPTVMHDLHESVPYLYIMTGTGPYNAWLDPIVISEWQEMAYHEIEEMTKRGVIGVWTHGFYDGWAPNYLLSIANNHNSIGRFYETFGNGGADTRVRTLRPPDTSREWFRPNPPLPKVKWSARDNINMQESAILFGMNNVATNGQKFLNNFYLKSKRAVAKARAEGPAAWVFPADDPRPAERASLLRLFELQGIEVHRTEKEIRLPALNSGRDPDSPKEKSAEKSSADARSKEEKRPAETVIPAGSYVVRMDQPYSRLADMVLDTQYYSPRDPRSYDDTGWTLGALRGVKTVRVTDVSILDAPMRKVGEIELPGGVDGQGKTFLIRHNTDNTLATLRFRLASVPMEAAEDSFEADGLKFNSGTFIVRNADRPQLEKAAAELGLRVHSTNSTLTVAAHPISAARVGIVHNWQNTQNDGWFRIAFDELKIPYTYVADTWLRENANLREKFDVLILPPMGGGGAAGLSSELRGLPMRGGPRAWENTPDTPNFVAPGLDSSTDIRGGLGYQGLANLERFVSEGGLLLAVQSSAALPVAGGMTEMVNVSDPRAMQAPGSVVAATVDDRKSPISYGYDDKLFVYFRQGPVITVGGIFGGFGPEEGPGASARSSGRGSLSDPDVIQARPYVPPEKSVKRTPHEQELYVPEDLAEFARWAIPPPDQQPRVVLRFAAEKDLLLSGMITGANEIAEKPAVVDVPHGKGHVVLFANNPIWRAETTGSYFLVFNAILNFDHLNAGGAARTPAPSATTQAGGEDHDQN
ncbi:MAG TPA: M14 family zinc carboxypeptidase [Candidatus Sulfotelmatobacter sp.]|nr:M14 family zinc carboxypeptidase [Candidatus Sulfotelmatobacter sp.]